VGEKIEMIVKRWNMPISSAFPACHGDGQPGGNRVALLALLELIRLKQGGPVRIPSSGKS
jgi:hypothetical protein